MKTNRDYMLQLKEDDPDAIIEVHSHKELLESNVTKFIVDAGVRVTTENKLEILQQIFASETAISTKRISDLEEQVKLLLTRLEG